MKSFGWILHGGTAQVLASIAGLATNIVYARALGLVEVGFIATITAAAMMLTAVVDRGVGPYVSRALAAREMSVYSALVLYTRVCKVPLILAFAICCVTYVLAGGGEFSLGLALTVFTMFSFLLFQTGLGLLQGVGQYLGRSSAILANGLLTLFATFLVAFTDGGTLLYLVVSAAAYIIVGIASIWFANHSSTRSEEAVVDNSRIYDEAKGKLRRLYASNLLVYSVGVGDVVIASLILPGVDVGLYQLIKKVAQAITLPLTTNLGVLIAKSVSQGQSSTAGRDMLRASLAWFCVASLALSLFGEIVLSYVFGPDLRNVGLFAIIMLSVFSLQFLRDYQISMSNAAGEFEAGWRASLISVVTLLIFGPLLGKLAGLYGFGAAMQSAFLFSSIFLLRKNKNQNLPESEDELTRKSISLWIIISILCGFFSGLIAINLN